MKEIVEQSHGDVMLDEAIGIRDLMQGGTSFTIRSNFQNYDDDDDDYVSDLPIGDMAIATDMENRTSPWDESFAELIPFMTNIGEDIYKKIVKQPVDNVAIQGRCRVTIAYNAYQERQSAAFDSTFMRNDNKTFVIGDGEVLAGLELAVLSMKRKEESQFIIPYALLYGEHGCPPRILAKADCLFVIQLLGFTAIGDVNATDNVPIEDKRKFSVMVDKIMEVKASGNDHYGRGAYAKAARVYHQAIDKLEMCQLADEEEEKLQRQHLITLYVNAMTCYNKIDQPAKVCSVFKDLSRLTDPSSNAKALFQHGKALIMLGEFVRAKDYLKKAARLRPNDSVIADQLKNLNEKHAAHKKTETEICRRAFGNDEVVKESQKTFEVSEKFMNSISEVVAKFQNDDTKSKEFLPKNMIDAEISFIRDFIKDRSMKLVNSEIQGVKDCYLSKEKK